MSPRWLFAASGIAHLAVAGGLFVSGVWRLERVHADPIRHVITLPVSPPAPSGGFKGAAAPEVTPKPHPTIVKVPIQPVPKPTEAPTPDPGADDPTGPGTGPGDPNAPGTCTENCGETNAAVPPVCGDGSVDASEPCDDGNTAAGDGCSPTCQLEPKPQPRPTAMVAPNVLQGLRISGETQLRPTTVTQDQMIREGATSVRGVVKLCIGTSGGVTSATMADSTKFPAYDATLLSAVHDWRYQPYLLGGVPVPACSMVTFLYTMK